MVEYGSMHMQGASLYGLPWPSEELLALFAIVPDKRITVAHFLGLSMFRVYRFGSSHPYDEIPVADGNKFDIWQRVLAKGLEC